MNRIVSAEHDLEALLRGHAEAGVPELALVDMLRDYADLIDDLGYVPRTWRTPEHADHLETAEIL